MLKAILAAVLLGLIAAMGIGGYMVYDWLVLEPQREAFEEQEVAEEKPPPEDPSLAVWRLLLAEMGKETPRDDMARIRSFLAEYPASKARGEALDLLTAKGARWLFSSEPAPWKETYRVVSGDSISRIAYRQGVASDWIMKVNNLMDTNLKIGQELLLPKPDLRLIASRAEGRLFVLDGEELLLSYPAKFSDVGEAAVGETRVREKIASTGGRRFAFGSPGYVEAEKTISLGDGRPEIRLLPEGLAELDSATLPAGLLMSRPDLEEVFLLVKSGTPVIIE